MSSLLVLGENCYEKAEIKSSDSERLLPSPKPLSGDWVTLFGKLIYLYLTEETKTAVSVSEKSIINALNVQVPKLPKLFLGYLQTLYRLMDDPNQPSGLNFSADQCPALAEKLYEGMVNCSEGFQNRIGEQIQGMIKVDGIDAHLQLMREDIVSRVASSLLDSHKMLSQQVHIRNTVVTIAHSIYGVRAHNKEDRYNSFMNHDLILESLQNAFKENYTSTKILNYLETVIHEKLQSRGYCGRNRTELGYSVSLSQGFVDYLNGLFNTPNLSIPDWLLSRGNLNKGPEAEDDYDAADDALVDLNWTVIRQKLLTHLAQKNIIKGKAARDQDNIIGGRYDAPFSIPFEQLNSQEQAYMPELYSITSFKEEIDSLLMIGNFNGALYLVLRANYPALTNDFREWIRPVDKNLLRVELLNAQGSKNKMLDLFFDSCKKGNTDIVENLFQAVQDIPGLVYDLLTIGDSHEERAKGFLLACAHGRTEIVKTFLDKGRSIGRECIQILLLAGSYQRGLAVAFQQACQRGHLETVKALLDVANEEPDFLIKEMVLAGVPGTSMADGFYGAIEKKHTSVVQACLEGVKHHPDLMRQMLLADFEGNGRRRPCFVDKNGLTDIAKVFFEAAKGQHELIWELFNSMSVNGSLFYHFRSALEKRDAVKAQACLDVLRDEPELIKKTIFSENSTFGGPVENFVWACKEGDERIVEVYLSAVKGQPELTQKLLLAVGYPSIRMLLRPAAGFREACRFENSKIVRACLEAAKGQPELIREMLLVGTQDEGQASGVRASCSKGRSEILDICLEAAKGQPGLVRELLLAGTTEELAIGFIEACKHGHFEVFQAYLNAAKGQPELVKEILMAESPDTGPAHGFRLACKHGHFEVVQAYLNTAKGQPELVKEILMAESPGTGPANGFRTACQNGHLEVVQTCLNAAKGQPELVKEILMAEYPGTGPAHGFRLACQNGHLEVVQTCINAAKGQPELVNDILMAGFPDYGPARGFRLACQNGHLDVVKACLNAAKGDPRMIRELLSAEAPDRRSKNAFILAFLNGHTEIVELCLTAVQNQPWLIRELLLADFSENESFTGLLWACEKGHAVVVSACLDALKKWPDRLRAILLDEGGVPGALPAVCFYRAFINGHADVVKALLEVAVTQPDILGTMLSSIKMSTVSYEQVKKSILDIDKIIIKENNHDLLLGYYGEFAGFFSWMNFKIMLCTCLNLISKEELVDEIKERAKVTVDGASIKSLIKYNFCQNSTTESNNIKQTKPESVPLNQQAPVTRNPLDDLDAEQAGLKNKPLI